LLHKAFRSVIERLLRAAQTDKWKGGCEPELQLRTTTLGFWGISQLCYAFIFLRWFKLVHIYIQVAYMCSTQMGVSKESVGKFLIGHQDLRMHDFPSLLWLWMRNFTWYWELRVH